MKKLYTKHFENIPNFWNLVYIYTSWQHWLQSLGANCSAMAYVA